MTRLISPDRGSPAKHVTNPDRLVEGPFGRLLKDANREFAGKLDQPAAFQRVTERLSPARTVLPRRTTWLVPAALLAVAGLVALPVVATIVRRARSPETPALVAEDLREFRVKPAMVASAMRLPATSEPAEQAETRRADGTRAAGAKLNAQASPPASSNGVSDSSSAPSSVPESLEPEPAALPNPGIAAVPSAAPASAPEPADTATAPDCLSLARGGRTRDAEACFLTRAEGSGLGAEMALYEVARLRRDVLADAAGALSALAEYRQRFPTGSLRREADMSHLELLLQLGRSDEALKQSDELLSSSSSGERAAELHLLRGHVLRKAQSRFAEAEHEYELAESAGARGGEVTYFRALCLEALGRGPEAAALFAQYLQQPQRAYAEDARRRLQRLKP